MENPYFENNAYKDFVISFSEFLNFHRGDPIRIILSQSCPLWAKYELRGIKIFAIESNSNPPILDKLDYNIKKEFACSNLNDILLHDLKELKSSQLAARNSNNTIYTQVDNT